MSRPSLLAQACLFSLAALVVIGLYVADGVDAITTLLFCAAAAVAWFRPASADSRRTWLAITVLFIVYAVANALLSIAIAIDIYLVLTVRVLTMSGGN